VKTLEWHCRKCGTCCREIINEVPPYGRCGLTLLPEEIHLFPPESIKPFKAYDSVKTIAFYQMVTQPCSKFNQTAKLCAIYDKRPQACRAFPFNLEKVSGTCPHTPTPRNGNVIVDTFMYPQEFNAAEILDNINKKWLTRRKRYFFNLDLNRWVRL